MQDIMLTGGQYGGYVLVGLVAYLHDSVTGDVVDTITEGITFADFTITITDHNYRVDTETNTAVYIGTV